MSTPPSDLSQIHPDLPGEATVAEMFTMVWPHTKRDRPWLVLLVPMAVVLFGLSSLVPLLAGEGLQRALAVEESEQKVTDYLDQYESLAAADRQLRGDDMPISIPTEVVMARLPVTADTLDSLFGTEPARGVPSGLIERVRGIVDERIGSGELPESVRPLLESLIATGEVVRADLEFLVDPVASAAGDGVDVPADSRAVVFDVMVRAMAEDEILGNARSSSSRSALVRVVAVFVAVALTVACLRFAASRIVVMVASRTGLSLQRSVFRQVHDSALVDSGAVGRTSMINRCSSYVDTVETAVRAAFITGAPTVTSLVLSLGFLIWISLPIGAAMTAVVVVLEVLRRRRAAVWSRRSRALLTRSTAVGEHIDGAIVDAPALRVSGGVPATREHFDTLSTQLADSRRRVTLTGERLDITTTFVGQIALATVIAVVGLASGSIGVAQATAAVLYVGRVAESLAWLPALVAQLQDSAPAARELRRVLQAPPMRPEPEIGTGDTADISADSTADVTADVTVDVTGAAGSAPMVSVQAVHAAMPGHRPRLIRCSFDVPADGWTVLTGPVRAETSLIIDVIAGQLPLIAGRVCIAGSDIGQWPAARFRSMVTVVPAHPVEFHGTVRDHLDPFARDRGVGVPDRVLLDALGRCGLDSPVFAMPDGLDTGLGDVDRPLPRSSRIRLAVARACVDDTPIVVVDDPTEMLDVDAAAEIWALMRRCFADRTVVAATPRLEMIDDRDRVVVVRNGKVAEQGRRSQLMAAGGMFARWWSGSRAGGQMVWGDLPGLEDLDEEAVEAITSRLVTETHEPGQVIAVIGAPEERLYVVADGVVELLDNTGQRITLCGAGDHFGSLDPAGEATVTATARAVEPTVVMSLHRAALASGAAGVLDRPPAQRLLFSWLMRNGAATRAELEAAGGPGRAAVDELDTLLAERLVVVDRTDGDGPERYRVAALRRRRRSSSILGSLFGDG